MKIYSGMIVITHFLITFIIGATPIQQNKTDMLFHMWHLKTYTIESKEYPPNKKEKDDYILFKKDMTFISKSEGKIEEGVFIFNTNGSYILMRLQNGKKIKAYIISISNKSLILKYDINEISDVEVHYNNPI